MDYLLAGLLGVNALLLLVLVINQRRMISVMRDSHRVISKYRR